MSKRTMLVILDGWGKAIRPEASAIDQANTPYFDRLMKEFPNTSLEASGLSVGLPDGQMGNSEVGHMNLGAGRVVYQNLVKLNLSIENGSLSKEPVIMEAFQRAKGRKLHLIGLVSDGGVHAHIEHLKSLLSAANEAGLRRVYVHAFTDGRDCDPKSGAGFIQEILSHMEGTDARLASVVGRYFAMDRDKRWERVATAWRAMVEGVGTLTDNVIQSIENSYKEGVTDEFLEPLIADIDGIIEPDDVVICFNFRTDRGREITEALTQMDYPEFGMHRLPLHYVTLTNYDPTYQNVQVVFDESVLHNTLGEVLERAGKTQLRMAETEKYPHVTFFFSGGREAAFYGEKRLLCASPKDVPTYDLKPEMAAFDLRDSLISELETNSPDFICLNFANADMVGHTGCFEAAIKACEAVDQCLQAVADAAFEKGYSIFILADHGNSDVMRNEDGSPNTQHSTNLVPLIVMDPEKNWKLTPGKLGDVAPSILKLMEIDIPTDMTGNILIND